MYADKVKKFSGSGFEVPFEAVVECSSKDYEGTVMPGTDDKYLVLKLDNGYNIGIDFSRVKRIIPKKKSKTLSRKIDRSFDKNLPLVTIIATGGTIASRVDYKTGAVHALLSPEEFLTINPELSRICNLRLVKPFTKLSEDMDFSDYEKLSRVVFEELKKSRGVIVTHGTDTLHYTSAALSFALRDLNKPVAVVGAQRSSDRGSADGVLNLFCAVHYCLSDIAEVSVVMHGSIDDEYCLAIPGVRARKMHTERRDAFRPINALPFAKIWRDGKIEFLSGYNKRKDKKRISLKGKFSDRVALLKVYPNSEPKVLDFLVSEGFRGVVVEGTGFGHVPVSCKKSWIPHLEKASKSGMVFVQSSQCIYGRTSLLVYSNGRLLRDIGFLNGEDMTPEAAYIKLSWVLAQESSKERVEDLMARNIAGEFSARSALGTFLY